MKIQFLGAARQVTGSQYYVEADGARLLIDCGMFQEREFLERNWNPTPVPLRELDALLLTHAHVDHCGLAPKLVQEGFRGPIITTAASADLVEIVLRDSAEIQAEDAAFKLKRHKKEGRKSKYPIRPLYSLKDVDRTLPLLRTAPYEEEIQVADNVTAVFHDAGHILGSAIIELRIAAPPKGLFSSLLHLHREDSEADRPRKLIFTGDLGQWDKPIVRDPTTFTEADYVVMESTYGDREHEDHGSVQSQLEQIVAEAVADGGAIVIPIFAIERAQELIYHLNRLLHEKRIPEIPIFLDSPMAADVNEVFRDHRDCFDAEALAMLSAGRSLFRFPTLKVTRRREESQAINRVPGPCIILATSGMCTAGRIKHHLAQRILSPKTTVLFVGYQSRGTLGRQILDGNPEVRIHGRPLLVRAKIRQLHGASGHSDRSGLLKWLGFFQAPPKTLFVTHGDDEVALAFAEHVRQSKNWHVEVPEYRQAFELDGHLDRASTI
ncbi:MAG: MBL fold metallo-hydrolase [Pirellulales bacterium]|nr:MBL fold metallo-hydrolase [Pirellulales bacterium]